MAGSAFFCCAGQRHDRFADFKSLNRGASAARLSRTPTCYRLLRLSTADATKSPLSRHSVPAETARVGGRRSNSAASSTRGWLSGLSAVA